MAFLKPDKTYNLNGLTIKEKLITSKSGVKYYSNKKLNTTGNKPEYITIHNTPDITEAKGTNDAEQYARATFNNAMGSVVVHYYIDETDCWHILADDTIGWHAADGKTGPGNTKSIAIEIIMDGSGKDYDTKAEDRGALLAASLLYKYGLTVDKMKTHKDWYPKKTCPAYILPHWSKFVAKVTSYYNTIKLTARKNAIPTSQYYRLQFGSYSTLLSGEKIKKEVIKKGFSNAELVKVGGKYILYSEIVNTKDKIITLQDKAKNNGYTTSIYGFNIVSGDVDGDGKITSADSRLALRASVGSETLTQEQKLRADVDGDGKITSADARTILRRSVGNKD